MEETVETIIRQKYQCERRRRETLPAEKQHRSGPLSGVLAELGLLSYLPMLPQPGLVLMDWLELMPQHEFVRPFEVWRQDFLTRERRQY